MEEKKEIGSAGKNKSIKCPSVLAQLEHWYNKETFFFLYQFPNFLCHLSVSGFNDAARTSATLNRRSNGK